jgi:hypothetical protein
MQIGEAVVSDASQGPKGAQEVEFKAFCSGGELRMVERNCWRVAGSGHLGSTPTWRAVPI